MNNTSKTKMLKYKKINHFKSWLENTTDIKIQKYTEEQYKADLKKWFEYEKKSEKQINSIQKYYLQYYLQKMIKILNGENKKN